jgi:hypothetical protein
MPIKYIQYKGKKILFVDFSNMTGDQAIATIDEEVKEMQNWTEKGLVLNVFYNAKATSEFMAHAKKAGKEVFVRTIYKSAAVGLTGLQMVLLQAYNTFSKDKLTPFKTEEEAKEWLIKED